MNNKFSCEVNGFVICQDISQKATFVYVTGYDEIKILDFFKYAIEILTCTSLSVYFADIWERDIHSVFFSDYAQHEQLSKTRQLYILDASTISKAQEYWFDTRCTLLGGCSSKNELNSYILHHNYCPEKAVRCGYLSAFICGDEANNYCIGIRGQHHEIFDEIKELLGRSI